MKTQCEYSWVCTQRKCHGVNIPLDLTDFYKINSSTLQWTTEVQLSLWLENDFSWLDRIQIVKKKLHSSKVLLFILDSVFSIKRIHLAGGKNIHYFVWVNKQPQFQTSVMYRLVESEGLHLPILCNYYIATMLTDILR